MKFTVQLVTRVPLFADLEIEAETGEEALAQANTILEAGTDEEDAKLHALTWTHGEAAFTPFTARLDDRDLAEITIQGVGANA